MKNYNIQKHDGNINQWLDTFTATGSTKITPELAEDFNSRFETTGVKYVKGPTAENVNAGMVSQTNPSLPDVKPDSKPDIEVAKGENGEDIDLTHSEQKPWTATELDHGTIEVANTDGVAATDNATALQDSANKVENDDQINSK